MTAIVAFGSSDCK